MAILIVLGGGSTVSPILIALLLLESRTMISCLFPSAAVFLVTKKENPRLMHHLWSFLCFIIKCKLTTYLEMKTSGPDSAWEGLATAQHRKKEIRD